MNGQEVMKQGFVRICSLLWADILVLYALFVMQNYLTDVWEISITHAAGIINIWNGISKILPVFFLFLVDAFMGHFMMLVISSLAYSVGISFIAMSTPPVLGPCDDYDQKCIGGTQKVIFYIGMALTAAGMAGHLVSIHRFLDEQTESTDRAEETSNKTCLKLLGLVAVVLISIIAAIALPYIKTWSIRFGIPAIFTTAATLVFFSGGRVYVKVPPMGSPMTNVLRVFWAFLCKYTENYPDDEKSLHKKDEQESFKQTRFLRRLEKAAIKLPDDMTSDGQVKNRWKLCSVSEVEEAKIAVRMVPMWLTFIVCGMVSSIGDTYFIEQASHMNRKIGAWTVPLPALLLLYEGVKSIFGNIANGWLEKTNYPKKQTAPPTDPEKTKYRPSIGIGIAMVFSILCCITAAKIEKKRLRVIRKHDLLEKPDAPIPMSVYWLLFQFVLLAGLNAFSEKSVAAFYTYQGPHSMKYYLEHFTRGVFGLGFVVNVISVHVVGKISEKGGKKNWFQFTLSKSRLDRYYWFLAALSSVNLVVFIVVASCYKYRDIERPRELCDANGDGVVQEPPKENEEEEGDEEGQA